MNRAPRRLRTWLREVAPIPVMLAVIVTIAGVYELVAYARDRLANPYAGTSAEAVRTEIGQIMQRSLRRRDKSTVMHFTGCRITWTIANAHYQCEDGGESTSYGTISYDVRALDTRPRKVLNIPILNDNALTWRFKDYNPIGANGEFVLPVFPDMQRFVMSQRLRRPREILESIQRGEASEKVRHYGGAFTFAQFCAAPQGGVDSVYRAITSFTGTLFIASADADALVFLFDELSRVCDTASSR